MRSTAIAWLLFVAGCTALALDGPDTERATAERRDRPPEKASGDATCEAGSVPVLDESFGEDSPGWPEDWLIAGDGEGFVEDGAGQLAAEPGKRVRVTLRRPVDWTEIRIKARFADGEPQSLSIVDHGPSGEGFALTAFRSFEATPAHRSRTQWLLTAGPADRRIEVEDGGPYSRSQWIRLRARVADGGRSVQWRRTSEGGEDEREWTELMQLSPPGGQLALVFEQGRAAQQADALRIERVVVCRAAP